MALNGLVGSTSGDLRQQLERYSRGLEQLVSAKKRGDSAASRFARRSASYFEAWNKQLPTISDEQLRKESMARKADVMGQYQATSREQQDAQNGLGALIGYLKDIRKALSADLTTAGLQSVRPASATPTKWRTRSSVSLRSRRRIWTVWAQGCRL